MNKLIVLALFNIPLAVCQELHPPRAAVRNELISLCQAYLPTRAVQAAVRLGIFDCIGTNALDAHEIAQQLNLNEPCVERLLRILASHGLLEESSGRYRLTPKGVFLQSDTPDSLRDYAIAVDTLFWDSVRHLEYTIATGQSAFENKYGAPFYDYLQAHPETAQHFNAYMRSYSAGHNQLIVDHCPCLGSSQIIVDVGGGNGEFTKALLVRYPSMKGIVLDSAVFDNELPCERFTRITGSFMTDMPRNADAYILKNVLIDWDDQSVINLLTTCKEAMSVGGSIFIIDSMIQPGNEPTNGKDCDVLMMALLGHGQRSVTAIKDLLAQAGLRVLTTTAITHTDLTVIQAVAA